MPPEEQFFETAANRWKRELPWLRIFRGFRLAIDPRKLALALAALLIFMAGNWLLAKLPFSPASRGMGDALSRTAASTDGILSVSLPDVSVPDSGQTTGRVSPETWGTPQTTTNLLANWKAAFEPLFQLVQRHNTWSDIAWAWTNLLWVLIVSALFGGAIARIAALQIAGEGVPSLRGALQHSRRFFPSYLGGPLLPMVGLGLFWLLGACAGLVGLIPGFGPTLLGAFWFLPLIFGVALALIFLGIALSWPLMYCTISVEGSDAFDAFSRSFNYLFSRGWYALFLLIATLIYGTALVLLLSAVAEFAIHLTHWSVASGLGDERLREHFGDAIRVGETPFSTLIHWPASHDAAPFQMATIWTQGYFLLLQAFMISFFWCAATIGYLLLRHAEDATPFHRVYWIKPLPQNPDAPPLSGMAAAEHREQQADAEAPPKPVD